MRQKFHSIDTWISKDNFLELRQQQSDKCRGRPQFFFSHNPVVCGLFQFALQLNLQREGIRELNGSAYGMSMAHLYNAAQTEGNLTNNWPDMEKFIGFHGDGELFTGGRPRTVEQYLTQFLLVQGVSSQQFAKDRRHKGFKYAADGPRRLKTSEFAESFEKLLCKTDPTQTDLNVDLIETLLHRMAHSQSKKGKQEVIRQSWEKSHALTPIQLLTLLEKCMLEEEPKLAFNYCAIFESSWHLLALIATELGTEFIDSLNSGAPKHDRNNINQCLHYLPQPIFAKLAKERKRSKAVATKEDILARVARVIDDFVSKNAKDPSPTVIGVVNDQNLTTDFEHGTQKEGTEKEVCIHWGRCKDTGFFSSR